MRNEWSPRRVLGMSDQLRLPGIPGAPEPPHAFVEPRFVAAVGLAALAFAGVGLMLAHVFIVVGLLISLASSAGIISIYARHFDGAYQALAHKTIYAGPSIRELLAAGTMVIVIIPLSIAIFFNTHGEYLPRSLVYDGVLASITTKDKEQFLHAISGRLNNGGQDTLNVHLVEAYLYLEGKKPD